MKYPLIMNAAIFISISLLFLSGCSLTSEVVLEDAKRIKEHVVLGHCPTMAEHAHVIENEYERVSSEQFSSTASAVAALKKGDVDVILVGRVVKETELQDAFENRLRDGLTLVGSQKQFISLDRLYASSIHTAVSEQDVKQYLPSHVDVMYYDSLESSLREGLHDVVLINWSDYTEDMELVIPVDSSMNKIEKFRLPILYSYNESLTKLQV
ncbi:MAG: hypothetical protein ACQESE_00605 [Nanobdellota archaeon]